METTIKKLFSDITKIDKKLIELADKASVEPSNEYYSKLEILRQQIRSLLKQDFSQLSGKQFLKLNSMIGKYRPCEPPPIFNHLFNSFK
jgi:hypothetical protein